MTRLPAVLAVMSRASRIGTPLEIIVPRVRVKRATATFLMILVIVGDIAVLSLVTIMLLFAKGNLPTTETQSQP